MGEHLGRAAAAVPDVPVGVYRAQPVESAGCPAALKMIVDEVRDVCVGK